MSHLRPLSNPGSNLCNAVAPRLFCREGGTIHFPGACKRNDHWSILPDNKEKADGAQNENISGEELAIDNEGKRKLIAIQQKRRARKFSRSIMLLRRILYASRRRNRKRRSCCTPGTENSVSGTSPRI